MVSALYPQDDDLIVRFFEHQGQNKQIIIQSLMGKAEMEEVDLTHNRLKQLNGHLQMPVSRMISCPNKTGGNYRANAKSPACPVGYSQEEAIKTIWTR